MQISLGESNSSQKTLVEKIAEMEEKKKFFEESNKTLDQITRMMISKVIKVIDYLIGDNTDTAARNF